MAALDTIATEPTATPSTGYLFGPTQDFLWLGGISLIVLPLLVLLPGQRLEGSFVIAGILGSIVINNPHFAISYRIFYEDFGAKTTDPDRYAQTLRLRYVFAGVIVPIGLVAGFLGTFVWGSAVALAYSYNVMTLFVGWHYVKQGYGMAMVTAASRRMFYSATQKKMLLVNSYAAWGFAWLLANQTFDGDDFLGMPVQVFDIPVPMMWVAGAGLALSTVAIVATLGRRMFRGQPTSWVGVVAYVVSLYLWLVYMPLDPLVVLVVPALHSVQYLYVVARFETNRFEAGAQRRSWRREYGIAVALGIAMFWIVPLLLDTFVPYDEAEFGSLPFLFTVWVGINIHHYFLDNVMWRRGNPDVSAHLFANR